MTTPKTRIECGLSLVETSFLHDLLATIAVEDSWDEQLAEAMGVDIDDFRNHTLNMEMKLRDELNKVYSPK